VYVLQLVRSSSSVAANYIEACEPLGKADKRNRMRIARKEAKESIHWLRMLDNNVVDNERAMLTNEADQIRRILSAIIKKLDV
jgi:four helix bundle protein